MLPLPCVFHRNPGLSRFKRISILQKLDGYVVWRPDKGHAPIPGRSVNGDATIHELLACRVNIRYRVGQMTKIAAAENMEDLGACGLVIEAATENELVKQEIFSKLCPLLGPDAIIATNTSSISITRLASSTDRPEQFIQRHLVVPRVHVLAKKMLVQLESTMISSNLAL